MGETPRPKQTEPISCPLKNSACTKTCAWWDILNRQCLMVSLAWVLIHAFEEKDPAVAEDYED